MNFRRIVIASHNAKKAHELSQLLSGVDVLTLADFAPAPVPQETGSTFAENAAIKAIAGSLNTGELCLADDSGLCVDALGGEPGVHSAHYAGRHGDDAANNALLLRNLADCHEEKRTASFACALAVAHQGRVLFTAEGRCPGRILREARGEGGFGYDPLFVPDSRPELGFTSDGRTFAELPAHVKNTISHRALAMRELAKWLASLNT